MIDNCDLSLKDQIRTKLRGECPGWFWSYEKETCCSKCPFMKKKPFMMKPGVYIQESDISYCIGVNSSGAHKIIHVIEEND